MSNSQDAPQHTHRTGYAALVGRPNAGKSTLMNAILGEKISITTHKPQTTRHQLLGIFSDENTQIVFLDTPGIIDPTYKLQEAMMKSVDRAKNDADVLLYIVDASNPKSFKEPPPLLAEIRKPVITVINKIDLVTDETLNVLHETLDDKVQTKERVEISALGGEGVPELMLKLKQYLPAGPPLYPEDQISEQPVRFFVSEMIREQVFLQFQQEVPYSVAVEIVDYSEGEEMDEINANIVVNKDSQKGILIGKGGTAIKQLGIQARKEIEAFVGKQVHLQLFVKVRKNWRDKDNMVRYFGY